MRDINFNRPSKAFSRLCQLQNLIIDFENAKVIPTSDYYTLKIKKSLQILNKGKNNFRINLLILLFHCFWQFLPLTGRN